MGLFNFGLTGEDKVVEDIRRSYERVEKAMSKAIGELIADGNLIGSMGAADDDSLRTATNIMQVIGTSNEFIDKLMGLDLKMYENVSKIIEFEEKRVKEIENLHKENEELKRMLYKITDKLDKLDKSEK